jgi:hypothetical protein
MKVRQQGDSRKCSLPQNFYPPECLQFRGDGAPWRNEVEQVGRHVQSLGRYAIRQGIAGSAIKRLALSYSYDPEHGADHTTVMAKSRSAVKFDVDPPTIYLCCITNGGKNDVRT